MGDTKTFSAGEAAYNAFTEDGGVPWAELEVETRSVWEDVGAAALAHHEKLEVAVAGLGSIPAGMVRVVLWRALSIDWRAWVRLREFLGKAVSGPGQEGRVVASVLLHPHDGLSIVDIGNESELVRLIREREPVQQRMLRLAWALETHHAHSARGGGQTNDYEIGWMQAMWLAAGLVRAGLGADDLVNIPQGEDGTRLTGQALEDWIFGVKKDTGLA